MRVRLACLLVCLLAAICRATPPSHPPTPLRVFVVNDSVVICWPQVEDADQAGRAAITVVEAATGDERWSWRGPVPLRTREHFFVRSLGRGLIIASNGEGESLAIAAEDPVANGRVLWKSATIIACSEDVGLTYLGEGIDLATGTVKWKLGHRVAWESAGMDAATDRALIGNPTLPMDESTPLPLSVIDLKSGAELANGSVLGLRAGIQLEQRGDQSFLADGRVIASIDLLRKGAQKLAAYDSPEGKGLLKMAGMESPASRGSTSWVYEGRLGVVDADPSDTFGRVRLFSAKDGAVIRDVRVMNVASANPMPRGAPTRAASGGISPPVSIGFLPVVLGGMLVLLVIAVLLAMALRHRRQAA